MLECSNLPRCFLTPIFNKLGSHFVLKFRVWILGLNNITYSHESIMYAIANVCCDYKHIIQDTQKCTSIRQVGFHVNRKSRHIAVEHFHCSCVKVQGHNVEIKCAGTYVDALTNAVSYRHNIIIIISCILRILYTFFASIYKQLATHHSVMCFVISQVYLRKVLVLINKNLSSLCVSCRLPRKITSIQSGCRTEKAAYQAQHILLATNSKIENGKWEKWLKNYKHKNYNNNYVEAANHV